MSARNRKPQNLSVHPGWTSAGGFATEGSSALAIVPDLANPRPEPVDKGASHHQPGQPGHNGNNSANAQTSIVAQWSKALSSKLGHTPYDDVRVLGPNILELTTAHPSGQIQLFAKRSTRLGNLFRDSEGLSHAVAQCELVMQNVQEQSGPEGLATLCLATGLATWYEQVEQPHDPSEVAEGHDDLTLLLEATANQPVAPVGQRKFSPIQVRMPVLLHPVAVSQNRNGEYELTLEGQAYLNPRLAGTVRHAGGLLDPGALAEQINCGSGFAPGDALSRIESIGQAVFDRFEMIRRSMVGVFSHPGQKRITDLSELEPVLAEHILIQALTGKTVLPNAGRPYADQKPLTAGARGMALSGQGPLGDKGIGDLSAAQQRALTAVNTKSHYLIDTPIGCEPEPVVAAILADAVAQGRSVLYVYGQPRVAANLQSQLKQIDLEELLLHVPSKGNWRAEFSRHLLNAMNVELVSTDQDQQRNELVGVHTQLKSYVTGLHTARLPWGVSIYTAFHKVAELTGKEAATPVRFNAGLLSKLDLPTRSKLATLLISAAQHDAFSRQAAHSPWYGANLNDNDHGLAIHQRVVRLSRELLPTLQERIAYLARVSGLKVAESVSGLGELLQMLDGLRGTLDLFLPTVFEKTTPDIIAAVTPRKGKISETAMGLMENRKLRKVALSLVRPGVRVPNLALALEKVELQREIWNKYTARPGYPNLPAGLAEIQKLHETVRHDLASVERVMLSKVTAGTFSELNFTELQIRMDQLAEDQAGLVNLPEREKALRELRRAGLSALIADLTEREVSADHVAFELELAWWGSLLQTLLDDDAIVAQTNGNRLRALTARFNQLDREHAQSAGVPLKAALAERVSSSLADGGLAGLYSALVNEQPLRPRELVTQFGAEVYQLRPVLTATPALVPHLLPALRSIDLVVLDGVQSHDLPELVSCVARGRQVVVVGDRRSASGDALEEFSRVLPVIALPVNGCRRDYKLTQILAKYGYASYQANFPTARAPISVQTDLVDGFAMIDPVSSIADSPEAEVQRAVEYAIEHAKARPAESLAIVTLTQKHATAIETQLRETLASERTRVGFFGPHRPEPMVVTTAADLAGLHRDAIVFSLGLGRTAHGHVLHEFGPLEGNAGSALLNAVIGAARRRLHVIASFGSHDLDVTRLHGSGPNQLFELLAAGLPSCDSDSATGGISESQSELPGATDTAPHGQAETGNLLLAEVGEQLAGRGLVVEYHYGNPGGWRVPMVVGHPSIPHERLVAVLDDGAQYAAEQNLRTRDRHFAQELERLGWVVTQVWSVAAFIDPAAEAERIAGLVDHALAERMSGRLETAPIPVQKAMPQCNLETMEEYRAPVLPQEPSEAPTWSRKRSRNSASDEPRGAE